MYRYELADMAKTNLRNICAYMRNNLYNPKAAADFLIDFKQTMATVCAMPTAFSPCRKKNLAKQGLRFTLVNDYKVFFKILPKNSLVKVAYIKHALQKE